MALALILCLASFVSLERNLRQICAIFAKVISTISFFFGMVTVVFNTSTSILKFSCVTSHHIHGKYIMGKAVCSFHFHIVIRFNILHFQDA